MNEISLPQRERHDMSGDDEPCVKGSLWNGWKVVKGYCLVLLLSCDVDFLFDDFLIYVGLKVSF